MALRQMALRQMALRQMALRQVALRQMALRQMALRQMALHQMAMRQMVVPHRVHQAEAHLRSHQRIPYRHRKQDQLTKPLKVYKDSIGDMLNFKLLIEPYWLKEFGEFQLCRNHQTVQCLPR